MSCSPTYTYRPTFVPAAQPGNTPICSLPLYNKHRSRLFAGGTYFRSKEQGPSWNDIVLSVTLIAGKHTLEISHPDYPTEIFDITQGAPVDPLDPNLPCTPGIEELRVQVNHATTGSNLIEMYPRGDDIEFDLAGIDDQCLDEFPPTNMTGGEGGPTNSAALSGIRTGPERSIIGIQTMEDDDGTPITPPTPERLQQWNGTTWVEYSNTIQGDCPI